jgi:hypothetical protein
MGRHVGSAETTGDTYTDTTSRARARANAAGAIHISFSVFPHTSGEIPGNRFSQLTEPEYDRSQTSGGCDRCFERGWLNVARNTPLVLRMRIGFSSVAYIVILPPYGQSLLSMDRKKKFRMPYIYIYTL